VSETALAETESKPKTALETVNTGERPKTEQEYENKLKENKEKNFNSILERVSFLTDILNL
jgi:hypothetical protein